MQTQFDAKWLKALAVIMAQKNVRYYLCGVLVEVRPTYTRLVATDGHRMAILHRDLPSDEPAQESWEIIIPADVVKAVKQHRSGVECLLAYSEGKCTLSMLAGPDLTFVPVDGKFPDYERIIPKAAPTMEYAHFNPKYVADFERVTKIAFNARYPTQIWPNGKSAAAVVTQSGHPEFLGVLMAMTGDKGYELPAWATRCYDIEAAHEYALAENDVRDRQALELETAHEQALAENAARDLKLAA